MGHTDGKDHERHEDAYRVDPVTKHHEQAKLPELNLAGYSVIPGLVGLWRMVFILRLPRWERLEVLALIAVVLSVVAMTSGGAAGSQYHRLLLYMPFVSTPIMVCVPCGRCRRCATPT